MNHRRADWHRVHMDVVTGLYDAKRRGEGHALLQRLVDLVLRHAPVEGVALLQLEHRSLRCLARAPATCPDHTIDGRWLDVLLTADRIHLETPGSDGSGRIILPVAYGRFRGALAVWASVPRPHDSGFGGFLTHLRQEATEVMRTATGGETTDAYPPIAGIDTARAALSTGHDLGFFLALLERFVTETRGVGATTRDDLSRGDRASAARRMHSVKGNAGNIAALEVMRLAAAVEDAIRGLQDDVSKKLTTLDGMIDALDEAARPWFAAAQDAPAQFEGADPPAPGELAALGEHLARHNLEALDLFEALRPRLAGMLAPEEATRLARAVADLRFDEARTLLDTALPPAAASGRAHLRAPS